MNIVVETVKLNEEELLCYTQKEKEPVLGCIGHLRLDFGKSGREFNVSWFEHYEKEKNDAFFKQLFDTIIDEMRTENGLLADRKSMLKYCSDHPDAKNTHSFTDKCWEFRVLTQDYAFYIRCMPELGDYNAYIYTYDREKLFSHLAKERGLPLYCYSWLKTTKEEIRIDFAERGYCPYRITASGRGAEEMNRELGITKSQAEAMKTASMFGWNVPGANPKSYDEQGKPIQIKEDRGER